MNEAIRVLHVTGVPEGGVIGLLTSLHENIDRNLIQFDYLMPESAPFAAAAKKAEALGGRAFASPALAYQNYFRLDSYFDRFFSEHPEYKIVHTHSPVNMVMCLKHAKKHGVANRLCHSHNTKYADDPVRAFRNRLLLTNLRRYATGYFACSEPAGSFFFGRRNVHILKNAIAVNRFTFDIRKRERIRSELGMGDAFVIGSVAVMRRQKNHAFMLRVLGKYRTLYGGGKLLLVGDGELRADLERLAGQLGIREHVLFTGMREDVPDLLSAMDVFLMPSFYEGLGIALVEAQASGLPCAYSDIIPSEVRLTDLAHPLSLGSGEEEWARAIHGMRDFSRRSRGNDIAGAGYDISSSAAGLTAYYRGLERGASY